MGKTDPFIFSAYKNVLDAFNGENKRFKNVCFLGQPENNAFSNKIDFARADFYDISKQNWNINDPTWNIAEGEYDLVVCTRCAYFCNDVESFFNKCRNLLSDDGILFVDWGLGDHWRYKDYKVGWVKNGEHESFYQPDNFLWSTIWHDSFKTHPNYKLYELRVAKFGYDDVYAAINKETPVVYDILLQKDNFQFVVDIQTFWEDLPQIYFIFCGKKIK